MIKMIIYEDWNGNSGSCHNQAAVSVPVARAEQQQTFRPTLHSVESHSPIQCTVQLLQPMKLSWQRYFIQQTYREGTKTAEEREVAWKLKCSASAIISSSMVHNRGPTMVCEGYPEILGPQRQKRVHPECQRNYCCFNLWRQKAFWVINTPIPFLFQYAFSVERWPQKRRKRTKPPQSHGAHTLPRGNAAEVDQNNRAW